MAADALPEHADYLAEHVLNEALTVNYRILSRALKVHVNIAKCMLFDFHQRQNKRKPKTVHATYLLAGTPKLSPSVPTNGVNHTDDEVMRSSPPFPSSALANDNDDDTEPPEIVAVKRLSLVKEEDLEHAKSLYEHLTSIHVYSLEPGTLSDLQVLTDCTRRVTAEYASEDPLQTWKQYGVIQNEHVKRRTARHPVPVAPMAAAKREPVKEVLQSNEATKKPSAAKTANASETGKSAQTTAPAKDDKTAGKPAPSRRGANAAKPAPVRCEDSNIAKSFAANAKPKRAKSVNSAAQDTTPALSDEEADGDDAMDLDAGPSIATETAGKSKRDREAELKHMMDAEDEEMVDAQVQDTTHDDESRHHVVPNRESETPATSQEPATDSQQAIGSESDAAAKTTDGRRRGRRRVIKKRTLKDAEGYLVTKEEMAWESFSEDEPAAVVKKGPGLQNGPAKKAAGGKKAGQGNIMNFFGKK